MSRKVITDSLTDRELLQKAAKAADVGPLDFDYAEREGHNMYFGPRLPLPEGVFMAAMYKYWNPLEDDGDALRLAVKLNIAVGWDSTLGHATAILFPRPGLLLINIREDGDDPYVATRRAIVRAAALTGEEHG